ncbi:MAG: NAD(P)H dehydrogenase (quinone) [Saprospiraceae bacterium]|jgi:NAD(P)H dehydrogenase (quinone)
MDENKEQHIGKRYDLSGSKTYSGYDVASDIGELLNQEIAFVPVSVDQWIDAVKDHPTINAFLAKHLREFSSEVTDGRFDKTTDVVKQLTGHEPRSFKQYIQENLEVFKSVAA